MNSLKAQDQLLGIDELIVPFKKDDDSASETSDLGRSLSGSEEALEDALFNAGDPTDQHLLTWGMVRSGQ